MAQARTEEAPSGPPLLPGIHHRELSLSEELQIDFAERKPYQGVVCLDSGWADAFPTKTEKASEACRGFLKQSLFKGNLLPDMSCL